MEIIDANIGFKDDSVIRLNSKIGELKRKILRIEVLLDKDYLTINKKDELLRKQCLFFFFIIIILIFKMKCLN